MSDAKTRRRRSVSVRTPEILPPDAPESLKARWWREHVVRLNRDELSDLTGFSVMSIRQFEAGVNNATGEPPGEDAWKRYRTACASISAGVVTFDWVSISQGDDTVRFDDE